MHYKKNVCYFSINRPDTSRIFVQVGFGFYVEFTLDEALRFIGKKEKQLQERSDKLSEDVTRIKAHIRIVIEVGSVGQANALVHFASYY